jgi:hypothetical protein
MDFEGGGNGRNDAEKGFGAKFAQSLWAEDHVSTTL